MAFRSACIITTVHPPFDNRIFHKQGKSLSEAGYHVTLVAQHEKHGDVEGISIVPLPRARNRLDRIFRLGWRALWIARRQRAHIYHFHDPELIPFMVALRLLARRPVIYDVHEDYVTSIRLKRYLPRFLCRLMARVIAVVEWLAARVFTIVLAERYYRERFPQGTLVLNYPIIDSDEPASPPTQLAHSRRVLYTGTVTEDRGALIYAHLPHLIEDLHVYLVGRCSSQLAERLQNTASPYDDRLHLEGVGEYVNHPRISAYYQAGGWTAGLAIFPPNEHYARKELTKLFEYMKAGLPIIASEFPAWKEIVADSDCGFTVNPRDMAAVAGAIRSLAENPRWAQRMGKNGQRIVGERYHWDREARKLVDLYDRIGKRSE